MGFWFGLQGPALWGVEISTTSFFFLSIIESCVLTFLTCEAHEGARHLLSLILPTMTKEDDFHEYERFFPAR